jgi:hypothetical protein
VMLVFIMRRQPARRECISKRRATARARASASSAGDAASPV